MKATAFRARPHRARVLLLRFANVSVSILVMVLAGCGDKTTGPGPQPQPKYPPSSTPQNVLVHLALAYETRDSLGYDSLFDAAYAGTSVDQSDPSPVVYTFTKADEARHIGVLARTSTIVSIDLQFPPNLFRFTDASDPPGWATVPVPFLHLQIDDGSTSYILGSNATMEFTFTSTTPSPGSPTDTTWRIIRWSEIAP